MAGVHLREKLTTATSRWLNPRSSFFWLNLSRNLKRYKGLFDFVESSPLTRLQREAIILNEKRCLVVAGAGTGKTSSLVGKVAYLLKSGEAKPEEILLLAYNRDAATELRERIKSRLNAEPDVSTFHALGNRVLKSFSSGTKVSDFATQSEKYNRFLEGVLNDIARDPASLKRLTDFFAEALIPNRDTHRGFKSLEEYSAWVRSNELVTFAGERVKSYGELLIANHLFVLGIPYAYEDWFKPRKEIKGRPVYRPDFALTGTDAYIEYFGVDERGRTAPYVDQREYNKGIRWKKSVHRQGGTLLIEVAYHHVRDNTWKRVLDEQLERAPIKANPRPAEEILAAANRSTYRSRLLSLIATFLRHFKANQLTIGELRNRVRADARGSAFVEIFDGFYRAYEDHLQSRQEIDFNDMISKSEEAIRRGRYRVPWKYVIVDEFQDISVDRYRLIEQVLKQAPQCKLFCVGDDWQSIYRFTGSDISLMTEFSGFFGRSHVVKLDQTFRFNDKLAIVSENFVQKNPRQIKKRLKTIKSVQQPAVKLFWSTAEPTKAVMQAASHLAEGLSDQSATLQVLARYNHDLPKGGDLIELKRRWPGTVLEPKSCHAAKGLEADFVILTDLVSGRYGFPSEQQDDPLLDLVLAKSESFLHAEERRLLYVAITRAKEQAYLISNPTKPSEFALELSSDNEHVLQVETTKFADLRCPTCESGHIVPTQNGGYRCSNQPVCKYRAALCPVCQESPMVRLTTSRGEPAACCANEQCNGELQACPSCKSGVIIERSGRYGAFHGCHLFETTGCRGKPPDISKSWRSKRRRRMTY